MSHPERRRRPVVDTGRDASQCSGRHDDLLGECAEHLSSGHPVPDGKIACLACDFGDDACELAADHERRRHADLVLVGDE